MKTFELTFGPRLKLGSVLAGASGKTLGEITALAAVFEQVRFTEEELKQVKQQTNGSVTLFEPPSADFGTVTVTVEDSQAQVLDRELETAPRFDISDREWVRKLKKQLTV
jgi:hypothetical protein